MHTSSMAEMDKILGARYGGREGLRVLDVGSLQGRYVPSYRDLMRPTWLYEGCDLRPGKNVDFVNMAPYRIRDDAQQYDLVLSGQCLEHCPMPWRLVCEMARMLDFDGEMVLTAPWAWRFHAQPVDCWRVLPDGMRALFENAGLETVETYRKGAETWGIARMR